MPSCSFASLQRLRQKQRGFTLVELMIALFIGSIAILSIYEVFRSNTRQYYVQEQQLEMVESTHLALEFMKEELQSAGRLSTRQASLPLRNQARPDPQFCGRQLPVSSIALFNNEERGVRPDFPQILSQFGNLPRPDRVRLLVDVSGATPLRVLSGSLQLRVAPFERQHTEAAQRALSLRSEARFRRLYDEQALLRVSNVSNRRYDLLPIRERSFNNGSPEVTVSRSPCVDCSAGGCLINPVHWIEYVVLADPEDPERLRTRLVRRRLGLQGAIFGETLAGEALTLASHVVNLQLWGLYDTHQLNQIPFIPPDPDLSDDLGNWPAAIEEQVLEARPQRVRGLELMIAVRSAREDPELTVPVDLEGVRGPQALSWFALNDRSQDGFARVRTVIARTATPNLFQEEQ